MLIQKTQEVICLAFFLSFFILKEALPRNQPFLLPPVQSGLFTCGCHCLRNDGGSPHFQESTLPGR